VRGAYSLVVLDEQRVIGVRDPYGFRPLVLGRIAALERVPGGDGDRTAAPTPRRGASPRKPRRWTSSARSTSVTSIRARSSSSSPAASLAPIRFAQAHPALCVFELIYFARPDSYLEGRSLYDAESGWA